MLQGKTQDECLLCEASRTHQLKAANNVNMTHFPVSSAARVVSYHSLSEKQKLQRTHSPAFNSISSKHSTVPSAPPGGMFVPYLHIHFVTQSFGMQRNASLSHPVAFKTIRTSVHENLLQEQNIVK